MAETPNRGKPAGQVVPLTADERKAIAGEIRTRIANSSLTYVWLIHRLSVEGVLTDKFEMSATLSGTRVGPKADEILHRSLSILTDYERKMET